MALTTPRLIIFAGLPGTGKTTLAETIGRRLGVPVFALDWLLGSLTPHRVVTPENGAAIGYGLLTTLATRQLMLGQSAILDSPAHQQSVREQWQQLAAEYGVRFYAIEIVCSDRALHQRRVQGRTRGIPGWHEVRWEHVERMEGRYEPWTEQHCIVDTVAPIAENIQKALTYIQGPDHPSTENESAGEC